MTLHDSLTEASRLLSDGDQQIAEITEFADAVLVLCQLRDLKRLVGELQTVCERHGLSLMPDRKVEVPGVGLVESKRRTKRTQWDHASLWRILTAYALDERKVDEETGEYEPAEQAVARVLKECAAPTWRVTALRARGLQIDEFCVEEVDGWSLVLPSPNVEGSAA